MKKILSSIVAALVAVSFAGIVCAAEPANTESKTESTATTPAGVKVEKKVTKKKKTTKKGKKVKKDHEKRRNYHSSGSSSGPGCKVITCFV